MDLGKNIKYYREKEGLTRKELGEKVDISEYSIKKYELGNIVPNSDMIRKISEALKIGTLELTGTKNLIEDIEQITDKNKKNDLFNRLKKINEDNVESQIEVQQLKERLIKMNASLITPKPEDFDPKKLVKYIPLDFYIDNILDFYVKWKIANLYMISDDELNTLVYKLIEMIDNEIKCFLNEKQIQFEE